MSDFLFGFLEGLSDSELTRIDSFVNIISTIFFAATTAFLILDLRLQRKGLRQDAYSQLRSDHQELMRFQVENKLLKFLEPKRAKGDREIRLSNEVKEIHQFYMLEFDLYERVWLGMVEEHVMYYAEWLQWLEYLEEISKSKEEVFIDTFNYCDHLFEKNFMNEVTERVIENKIKCKFCTVEPKTFDDLIEHTYKNHKYKIPQISKDGETITWK
ncbi:MAG: hypothetical protein ACREAE_06060 [Nitrosopumilaceae archaeon]